MKERKNIWNDMAQWDRTAMNHGFHRTLRYRIGSSILGFAQPNEEAIAPREDDTVESFVARREALEKNKEELYQRAAIRLKDRVDQRVTTSVRQSVNQALQASMRTPEDPKKRKWISIHE